MPCATHSRLMVRLRCRFIQAVAALSLIQSSVALLLMLIVGFRCVFCFDFCFLFPRSLTLDRRCFSMSSLRPSSLTGPSPCLYTAGAYCLLWKERDSNPRCHTLFRRLSKALSIQRLIPVLPSTTQPSFRLLFLCLALLRKASLPQQLHIVIHTVYDVLRYFEPRISPPRTSRLSIQMSHPDSFPWQAIAIVLQPILREHLKLLAQLFARQPLLLKA